VKSVFRYAMGAATLVLLVVASLALLAGCGGAEEESTPKPTTVASTTVTPTASPPEIETSLGTLVITEVRSSDRWPPDCDLEGQSRCGQSPEGDQILAVSLQRKHRADPISISEAQVAFEEAYVVAGDGSRADCFGVVWSDWPGDMLTVGFGLPASAHDFDLFVPGSPPVDLGR